MLSVIKPFLTFILEGVLINVLQKAEEARNINCIRFIDGTLVLSSYKKRLEDIYGNWKKVARNDDK